MKKTFRKGYIFSFILGAVIFGGIVGVSAYTILSNNIEYTPTDSTWKKTNGEDITNVKEAIDELYMKKNSNVYFLNGTMTEDSKNLSLNYTADFDGKVLVVATNVQGRSNNTVVTHNNETVELVDTNSSEVDDYRKIKYAVVNVKSGDTINCSTISISANGEGLVWSYSSCSLYGIR